MQVVGMHHAMVDAHHVALLHAAGKQLHTWTINEPATLRRMLDEGAGRMQMHASEDCTRQHLLKSHLMEVRAPAYLIVVPSHILAFMKF